MEISELKGKHLAAIQSYLQSLTAIYPGIDEDQDQMLVRLAMLAHGESPTNIARADELLEGDGAAYVAYCKPIIDLNGESPEPTPAADGNSVSVALPVSEKEITVRPLTGRQWRLGLSDAQRMERTAVMAGVSIGECQEMALLDYLTVEKATVPFVSQILTALMSGGSLSPISQVVESDSEI